MKCNNAYQESVAIFRAFFSPVIFVLGVLGNCLLLWIFSEKALHNRFNIYNLSLAICHLIILLFNTLLDDFLGRGLSYLTQPNCYQYLIKIDIASTFSCRLLQYLPETMYFISSWILVVFSIDRLLTISYPLKFASTKHHYKSLIIIAAITITATLLNITIIISSNITYKYQAATNSTSVKCSVLTQSQPIAAQFALYSKIVVAFIIPTFCVLVINLSIIIKLIHMKTLRKALTNPRKSSKHEMNRIIGHLAVSSFFLILIFPLVITMIMRLHYTYNRLQSSHTKHVANLTRLFSSIKDTSYAANCYIYLIFLHNFKWLALHKLVNALLAFRCLSSNASLLSLKHETILKKLHSTNYSSFQLKERKNTPSTE